MTRINVGINPVDLCDQMLLAEYRELPRCFNIRTNAEINQFCLGEGHLLWCAKYQWSLRYRHMQLCKEMLFRGFVVNHLTADEDVDKCKWRAWSNHDEDYARPLIRERIAKEHGKNTKMDQERYSKMGDMKLPM